MESILSPGFRSAAAMAGWDEDALLAGLVVEDTPDRESSKHKKRPTSTTHSNRKRRSRRRSAALVPPVVLCLDDEDVVKNEPRAMSKEMGAVVVDEEKNKKQEGVSLEKASSKGLPCMDRLREELSCAICLEICYEPSTTPCGHSFCKKCLKYAAAKCGRRCPKCRQLISNARSCTVNTVLWNTIQLLFPEEVEARKSAATVTSEGNEVLGQSPDGRDTRDTRISTTGINSRIINRRRASQVSQVIDIERSTRRSAAPSQSEDAAFAYRLQREEFMLAFQGTRAHQRHVLNAARANLRTMAAQAIEIRSRSRLM